MEDFKAEAREAFERKEAEELIRIAFVDNDDYREEAIELAREILMGRGINGESHRQVEHVRELVERERASAPARGQEPLLPIIKTVCLLMPVVGVIIAITKRVSGNKRASRDAWAMVGYGILLAFGIRILWTLLGSLLGIA